MDNSKKVMIYGIIDYFTETNPEIIEEYMCEHFGKSTNPSDDFISESIIEKRLLEIEKQEEEQEKAFGKINAEFQENLKKYPPPPLPPPKSRICSVNNCRNQEFFIITDEKQIECSKCGELFDIA